MIYLLLALLLMIYSAGTYLYSLKIKKPLPKATKWMFIIFFIVGFGMSYFALKEIGSTQENSINAFILEFPSLETMVKQKQPPLRMYEYLDILDAYNSLKRDLEK